MQDLNWSAVGNSISRVWSGSHPWPRFLELAPVGGHAVLNERERASAWVSRATWAFVGLGLVTRLVRYLVVYPIWHDEAFVAVNFLDRGYLDLLRPLDYFQVCPVLFLWIELATVRLLGFSELSLRLFPTISSLASVFLFRHLAARLLRGIPLLLAVGIFATAFYPIRHGAEVKPYASDLLAALVLLALAVEWARAPGRSRWWWALTLTAPPLLAVSYPSVFVAAGLAAALGPYAMRRGERPVRLAYVVYCLVLAGSFLGLYFTFTMIQSNALHASYRWGYWRDSFPPWDELWKVPGWLIGVHTGNTLAYPVGGERGASAATFIAALVGVLACWRRGRVTVALLLLSPFTMGLAAASLGQYPYGGASRITQYLAPSICILTGLGAACLLTRLPSHRWRRRALALAIGSLAALGLYLTGRDLVQPYRVRGDLTSRSFARWLWTDYGRDSELLCVKSDLGLAFQPGLWKAGMSAVYLFHQGTLARQTRVRRPVEPLGGLTPARPIRLVFFDGLPIGDPTFEIWLNKIQRSYRIARTRAFVLSDGKPDERWLRERYVIMELEPDMQPSMRGRAIESVARMTATTTVVGVSRGADGGELLAPKF